MDSVVDPGVPVMFDRATSDAEIEVHDLAGARLGTVSAGEHADVAAVLASGLNVSARLFGAELRLYSEEFRPADGRALV